MQRLHVSLKVENLDASIRFYSTLFASEPTLRKPDYAKWMLEDPRVNFSIGERGEGVGIEHLGIQVDSPEELSGLKERFQQAGGPVRDEGETICCYHHSDKAWVTDQQGVSWEGFYTSGEADQWRDPEVAAESGSCCSTDCCAEDPQPAS
ncbi:MAG: glyoxalase/bleomycin resistance/dioxygenase family protein [Deltaproteobacteria bacterium]|nr:glyoxalase/bleomycin resistance/dioxygenase family protein [Deltaproteobacteria bacterium]